MAKYQFTQPILSGKPDAYIASIYVDGKQYKKRISKKYSKTDQKKYAEALMNKWVELLNTDVNPFDTDEKKKHFKLLEKISFTDAYKEFQNSFVGSNDTLKAYKYKLNLIDEVYGKHDLENITTHDLETLLKEQIRKGNYSQVTLNQAKKCFNIFFNWCISAKYITESPSAGIGKLKSDKDTEERMNPFEEEDFNKIMEKIKAEDNPSLYYNINFIYHACLRPSEIQELKVGDIDIVNKRIRVKASVAKSNKLDYVPIYPALQAIIKDMGIDNADKDDYLFSRDSKNPKKSIYGQYRHRDDYFADWFRLILKDLDLYEGKGYSIYCFKHTSNIHKVDANWKTSELQKLNRHSSIDQTLTYLAKIKKVTEIGHLQSRAI